MRTVSFWKRCGERDGVLERQLMDELMQHSTGQTLLIMQKNEECYKQQCRTGSSSTVGATEGWLGRGARRVQRRSNGAVGEKRGLEEAGLRWSQFPEAWDCAGRRQLSPAI